VVEQSELLKYKGPPLLGISPDDKKPGNFYRA